MRISGHLEYLLPQLLQGTECESQIFILTLVLHDSITQVEWEALSNSECSIGVPGMFRQFSLNFFATNDLHIKISLAQVHATSLILKS